jgi:UDP-glucose 4-epimerase
VDERHPLVPVDVNGANKLAAENYHLVYDRAYDMHVSVLRLTNTYGPRMRVKDERQTFLGI